MKTVAPFSTPFIIASGLATLLAFAWLVGAGCASSPGIHDTGSAIPHATTDFLEPFHLQNSTDLTLLFSRRKAAGLDNANPPSASAAPRRVFAVLVNGGSEGYHQTNILNAAIALKQLGADAQNLFILCTGIPWLDNLTYNPAASSFLVMARPTALNFKLVLNYLGGVITSNDVVLIYLTGHGDKEDEYQTLRDIGKLIPPPSDPQLTTLALQGPSLTTGEFKAELESLQHAGQPLIIFLSDECYGGGFAQAVRETCRRYISMSITDDKHLTFCQTFSPFFWKILARRQTGIYPTPTFKAAFDEAMREHRKTAADDWDAGEFFCSEGLNTFSLSELH